MIITDINDISKIKVNVNAQSITINGNIDKMNGFQNVHADVIMRQISDQTGDRWGAVKLSGAWIISCVPAGSDATWMPIYGHRGENTRKFSKALANATGKAIVQTTTIGK